MPTIDATVKQEVIWALNRILELAGVVKYTHYALMVYGYNSIPTVSWLKCNAEAGLVHAHKAGEMMTLLGGHPSLQIGSCWRPRSTTSATSCANVSSMRKRHSRPISSCSPWLKVIPY